MGAPAISTRARPSRRPARRPRLALTGVSAVGRTAVRVGGIADSGVVVGMARGRAWIVVLGILLGGIVALNVWGLGLSAGGSAAAAKIDELQRESSVLRSRAASRTSIDRIEAAAAELGLAVPPPDGVHYLTGSSSDAEKAAERLANGRIAIAPPPPSAASVEEVVDPAATATTTETVVVEAPTVETAPATVDPVTGAPIDPATGAPIDPATGAPIDPATGLPLTP